MDEAPPAAGAAEEPISLDTGEASICDCGVGRGKCWSQAEINSSSIMLHVVPERPNSECGACEHLTGAAGTVEAKLSCFFLSSICFVAASIICLICSYKERFIRWVGISHKINNFDSYL